MGNQFEFETTDLWLHTLAEQGLNDPHKRVRDDLRSAFLRFRERVGLLVGEIHRDLPDLTVHDITHLDALWETASVIAGRRDYLSNPAEAFVFGGAVLLHDAGMGLAAYPGRLQELKQQGSWNDTVSGLLRDKLGRLPLPDELARPPKDIELAAIRERLRTLHADKAESLAVQKWIDHGSDSSSWLLDHEDLRTHLGPLIGLIARSHWWPVASLNERLSGKRVQPTFYPSAWTIDPLKIACLLRVADASHIDDKRAPQFLFMLRQPEGASRDHWEFQRRMHRLSLAGNRIQYGSLPFPRDVARAWWPGLETLRMIDRELREVDALFQDIGRENLRLAANSVVGVESPLQMLGSIPVEGWEPVEATIGVSDVPRMIERLGLEKLYGKDPRVPLRELIQNAADAVRARRLLEEPDDSYGGVIRVEMGQDADGTWLEVNDNGVGMSKEVLTVALLDFGKTYWGSSLMREEHPGLWGKGFEPIGRYGIGFFSVFMLGNRVRVTSLESGRNRDTTRVLEFNGLNEKPLLRMAEQSERIANGGTRVRVWLKHQPDGLGGLLFRAPGTDPIDLGRLCAWLCPTLDVDLEAKSEGQGRRHVVRARDWETMPGADLLRRLLSPWQDFQSLSPTLELIASNLRLIEDVTGQRLGRACFIHEITAQDTSYTFRLALGAVTEGGLRASAAELQGIAGILLGRTDRIIRDFAVPEIDSETLGRWASQQLPLVASLRMRPDDQMACAVRAWACGAYPESLPIIWNANRYRLLYLEDDSLSIDDCMLSLVQIELLGKRFDEVLILTGLEQPLLQHLKAAVQYEFSPAVLVHSQTIYVLSQSGFSHLWPYEQPIDDRSGTVADPRFGPVVAALARAWEASPTAIYSISTLPDDRRMETRRIALADGESVEARVHVIRNPGRHS